MDSSFSNCLNLQSTETVLDGGTGITSYAVGDLLYANTTATLAKLADVATGSVLASGGTNTAPAWSASPTLTGLTLTNQVMNIGLSGASLPSIVITNPVRMTSVGAGLRSVFIGGGNGGSNNTITGIRNTGVGYGSFASLSSGGNNTIVGDDSGYFLTTGNNNSIVGGQVGLSTAASNNAIIGLCDLTSSFNSVCGMYGARYASANEQTCAGYIAGRAIYSGVGNTFIGANSGSNTPGSNGTNTCAYNTGVGYSALRAITNGGSNVAVGLNAGYLTTTGDSNTYVGSHAAYNGGATATKNVFLGAYAGYSETGSQLLYISNSTTPTPLIWGDFVNTTVKINSTLVIGSAALTTSATSGFLYLPTCAGTPTGVPTAFTGTAATVYDTTANKLWIYNGSWRSATFA